MHHIIPINAIIKVEPYWNVKVIFLDEDSRFEYIKVEPYWNVKYFSHSAEKVCRQSLK